MSHAKNKVEWCLRKAQKELEKGDTHRGIVEKTPNIALAQQHVAKAEHDVKAISAFKEAGFSDWSASATFYAIYHSLLAVLAKKGFESRNQECTFALIYSLIEDEALALDVSLVQQIHEMNPDDAQAEPTVIGLRELEQYGVRLSLDEHQYERLLNLAKEVLDQVKIIIEE